MPASSAHAQEPAQEQAQEQKITDLPDVQLTGDLLYRIVAAELAASERQFDRASSWFLGLARETADPRLARKAWQTAVLAGNLDRAQRAIRRWLQISPDDPDAVVSAMSLAANLGQTRGMADTLRSLIEGAQEGDGRALALRQVAAIVNGLQDKHAALKVLEEALAPWLPTSSLANLMLADAAWQAEQPGQAWQAAQRAQQQAPDSEEVARRVLVYGMTLDSAATLAQTRAFLRQHPQSDRLGVQLAASLMEQDRRDEALQVLAQLQQQMPENVNLLRAQADLLMQAGDVGGAIAALEQASARQPQAIDIQYELGMLYERGGRMADFERMMQRIIDHEPEHANALNALGYTYADRNTRLDEARILIERALQLSPDSAHILDSMGWYYYRAGNLALARDYLERAWQDLPAADVAAHLGEVLWQLGERDQARSIWHAAWQGEADNDVLRETLRRYGVAF